MRPLRVKSARLQAQLDPHFMFNALNTLAYLIAHDAPRAAELNERLARVYRYILAQRDRPVVLFREEIEFMTDYADLLRLRFGDDAFRIAIHADEEASARCVVPPLSLQLLLENAVKHNEPKRRDLR